jgi:hypothetical protein
MMRAEDVKAGARVVVVGPETDVRGVGAWRHGDKPEAFGVRIGDVVEVVRVSIEGGEGHRPCVDVRGPNGRTVWLYASSVAPPPTQAMGPSELAVACVARERGVSVEEARALCGGATPPIEPKSPARERIEAKLAERKALAAAYFARANTACKRCGGPAYAGLLNIECMAAKCESPAELEPDALELVHNGNPVEKVWLASGRGVSRYHPTIEGAAAAWRLAVGGGR